MTDINKFSLGKDGKLGEIDFSKIKSGLKGSELIKDNEKLKSIFSRIDKNGDGKLDRTELDSLQELLAELSGDDNLSMKEAKKLEDEDGKLGRGGAKLLMELLNKMSEAAKAQGIKNVETSTGVGIEVVTYEDGHTEEVFEDGSVITTVKNGDKTTKTHKDKDGNLLNETVIEDGVETKTSYADGKKVKEVQTKENSVETTNYDSEGNPKDKTVTDKESGVVDSYEYKNGEFVLKKRVDSKNNSETVYDGDKETTTQTSDDTKTVTVKENGELVRATSTRKNENNETERTDTTYNGDDYIENFYVDDTVRRQKKVVDGKEYEVHYDANGNTEGVVVQNGESIALIAKRFGCSVEDLIKVNASKIRGKHPKVYFVVGEEIKIPGQMDAEDYAKIQAGRKSKAEAVGDYKDYIARIEEEKRIKAEQEAAEAQRKADEVAAQKKQEQKKEARAVAQELHDAIDEEHHAIGQSRFQTALRRVNKDNIVDVLKAYKEISPDLSLVKFIGQEFSAPTIRKDAVEYLAKTLYQKGIEVGVNKEELDKLLAEFKAEAKYQYITKVGKVDSAKLETILDAMLGSVIAKMQDAEEISDEEAIAQTAEMAQGDSAQAKSDFDTAREGEHWIAKSSDWVCGLFGCKTIGEMREKVGKHADEIEKLANAKDEVEFKKIFKEVFGVEFDKQKIAAYNTAVENYTQAYGYKSMIESVDTLILQGRTLSAGEFRDLIKEKFGYTDDEINQFIAAVGSDSGDLKEALTNALQLLKNTFQDNYNSITKGSSLEDMAQDIELIKKGVFGTNDIVKEVGIFNNNMQLTEAIGTGSLEILATVALAFIPGGQAAAGVRITAMVAKYGKLAVTLTRAAQTAVQAGIATYAVLKSDGRSVDEIKEHVKTNMAFAAGGVCSAAIAGRLAPIVAKTFKISGNVAKEVLEDAADMMASYVTSKGLGMEYGKTDAGVDMFMNFLMARLAHVQIGGKGVKAGNVPNKPNVAGELPEHQSTTKTLDKATSSGTAHPSEVRIGTKKAADIKNEVEEMLKNSDVSPEELARVRHEVGAIQDREMRRGLLRKIDEAASKLDPSAKATFDAARKANNKADVDHIFERHNELKNSDMRVLNEYIKSTDDIEALKELRTKLQTKEHEFGGVTQSYKTLYESIDNRIKSLEVKVHHSAEKKVGEAPDAAQAPKAEKKAETPNAEETPKAEEAPKAEKKADASKAETAPKTEKTSETKNTTSSAEELGIKLGKKLARSYYAVIKAIENMVSVADYKKIYKRIGVKFKNHMDVAKDLWNRLKLRAKELGLKVEKQFDDIKTKGAKKSNIEAKYRRRSDEFIPDELVRNAGNGGKPINENYVKASKDLREHYNRAIANGTYADSFENYVQTIIQGHKVAYGGFDGKHTWYNTVGQGSIDVNPGKIRGDGTLYSNRTREGQIVEGIARKYGDKYSTRGVSQVKLDGIPDAACPVNKGTEHIYPDGRYMHKYFEQMQRTAKEAIELIEKGAAQDKILAKLAEHYQYAANARPFGQINNSLFMNEINTLLQKAGMKPMPHGILDHVAQRMQPEAFKKYFIDEYKKTALDAPSQAKTGSEQKANSEFNKRGQLNSSECSFYNFDDLKYKMADKFNLFSQNTQDRILQDLATKGRCRLQKNGVEYQFTVNNGRVRLEEFDINAKYDIKQSRIDEYTTQKTYNIEDVDDIYFAISDELDLFSSETQNYIMASLSGGQGCVLRKYGIQFEFKIDRSGKITVSEFEYERFQNAGYYQRSNANQGANGSQSASSADDAQNYSRNMKPETRQAIEDLKDKIRNNNVSISELEKKVDRLNDELKKKFVLPPTQVKEYKAILGLPENAEVTASSLKAAYGKAAFKAHSDYGGSGGEAIAKIDEAYKALKKHYGFEGVNKAKIESEIADTQQAIEERKKEIAEYEDKINQLMNE